MALIYRLLIQQSERLLGSDLGGNRTGFARSHVVAGYLVGAELLHLLARLQDRTAAPQEIEAGVIEI